MNIEDLREQIKVATNNNNVVFLKDAFPVVPDWGTIIDLVDYVGSDDYVTSNTREHNIGFHRDMYIRASDVVDPNTGRSAKNISPELDTVLDFFNEVFEHDSTYSEAYINLKTRVAESSPHNDGWVAVAWGCIGSIEWRIYPNFYPKQDKEDYLTYVTNPGDVIIIPRGVFHMVTPLSPRASISLAY